MTYCSVRYAFDDLIDKFVATQHQSQQMLGIWVYNVENEMYGCGGVWYMGA